MAAELLNANAQIKMTHVPYKGAANAIIDLASGQIQVMLSNYSSLSPMLKAGRVRAVAVTATGKPGVPGSAAACCDRAWLRDRNLDWHFYAGRHTRSDRRTFGTGEINAISASPELKALLEPDGATPMSISATAFGAIVKQDWRAGRQIATDNKIIAE